jgi:hypothetical protein
MKKKLLLLCAAVVICGIAFYVGYSVGHTDGFKGYEAGYKEGLSESNQHPTPLAEKHHYEFKQNGVSIFRFDLDTGESCWLQLGAADAREEDHLTSPMQQCSK